MTSKALQLLDPPNSVRKPGFFLQVEGASIDERDHAAQPCEQIGETVDFDDAVRVVLDFARKDGNTLVIVTGDHGRTSQIVGRRHGSTAARFGGPLPLPGWGFPYRGKPGGPMSVL